MRPLPQFVSALDVWGLHAGGKVNVAGTTRTVRNVTVRGPGAIIVQWRERELTEAGGPFNTGHFLEAVGAYLEEAA